MVYIQKPPPVQMGLIKVTLANGQTVEMPRAFIDRLRFDLDASNQTTLHARGQELDQNFKAQQGMYTAYTGLNEYLAKINPYYAGRGPAVQHTQAYQSYQQLQQKYNQQQDLLRRTGANRQIRMTAGGQIIDDSGAVIRRDAMDAYRSAINEAERQFQGAMMNDLYQLQKIGQNTTISNLPITVTRSSNPYIRSSMAQHLSKLRQIQTT